MSDTTPKVEQAYYCKECEDFTELIRIYECNSCGGGDAERQCDQCKKFKARREDDGCENCFSDMVELVDVVTDHDGQTIKLEDYDPSGEAYSVKAEREKDRLEAEYAAKREAEAQEAYAGATRKTWADVKPGDVVLSLNFKGEVDRLRDSEIHSVIIVGDNPEKPLIAGTVIATVMHYGVKAEPHAPSDEVWVVKEPETTPEILSLSERFTVVDTDKKVHANPITLLTVNEAFSTSRDGSIPIGVIHGRTSEYSNMFHNICSFCDPTDARAYADAVELAAAKLREKDGVVPGEHVKYEFENRERWLDPIPDTGFKFSIGEADWGDHKWVTQVTQPQDRRGRMTYSFADPSVMESLAGACRMIADRLDEMLGWKK